MAVKVGILDLAQESALAEKIQQLAADSAERLKLQETLAQTSAAIALRTNEHVTKTAGAVQRVRDRSCMGVRYGSRLVLSGLAEPKMRGV